MHGDWVGGGGVGAADTRQCGVKGVCLFWVLEGLRWLGSGRGRSGWEVVGVAVVGKWEGLL